MNPMDIIRFLWRTGHFWNPAHPDSSGITEADLVKLTLKDQSVVEAVRSLQEADANFNTLVGVFHDRDADVDGDVGPATETLTKLKRCPVPDHPPPLGTRSADPVLDNIIRSMQEWISAGSGSWPSSGCDPERRGVHSIRVSIDTSRAPSAVKGYIQQSLEAAKACFAEMGLAVRYILDGGDGEIVKVFTNLSGGTIGWNYFPYPNSCRQITGRLDSGYAPDWRLWACLETHETGHGVGLEHTRGSIMNPSILSVWPLTWKGTPSEAAMRRFFGGEPIDVPSPPSPPTVPPTVPPGPPWPDVPPVGPPVPPPKQGMIVVNIDTRTVTLPPGWKTGG